MSEPVPEAASKERDPKHRCAIKEAGLALVEKEPVVPRARWGAMEPRRPPEAREGPIGRVFVVGTSTTQCKTMEQCTMVLQDLQEAKISEQGEDDLPYNFIVGGDGRVYEGRGWNANIPLPSTLPEEYEDGTNLIIGLIGDFSPRTVSRPPEKMVKARREFVMHGKDIGLLDRNIEVFTDIQWKI